MTITKEKVSKLEQDANRLVENLELLHEKVGSYNTAKETLNNTQVKLGEFITETKELNQSTHSLIQNVQQIGAIQIQEQLNKLNEDVSVFQNDFKKFESLCIISFSITFLILTFVIFQLIK